MRDSICRIAELLLTFADQEDSLVILYPHVSADGDALGSAQALYLALGRLGVCSLVLADEPPPEKLLFLPAIDQVQVYDEKDRETLEGRRALALDIHCDDAARTGRRQGLVGHAPLMAAIDHHTSSGRTAGLRLIETTAAATGELIHDLILKLAEMTETELMDRTVATCLMAAIVSDTGSFNFSNTTARTFRIAADLMEHQVDLVRMSYMMFSRTSQARLRLIGAVLSQARFELNGQIAVGSVPAGLMTQLGAVDEDLDGLVGQLRSVEGVRVAFLLRELSEGVVRVNIRSSELFDAARRASRCQGGGSPPGAGLAFVMRAVTDKVDRKPDDESPARLPTREERPLYHVHMQIRSGTKPSSASRATGPTVAKLPTRR